MCLSICLFVFLPYFYCLSSYLSVCLICPFVFLPPFCMSSHLSAWSICLFVFSTAFCCISRYLYICPIHLCIFLQSSRQLSLWLSVFPTYVFLLRVQLFVCVPSVSLLYGKLFVYFFFISIAVNVIPRTVKVTELKSCYSGSPTVIR